MHLGINLVVIVYQQLSASKRVLDAYQRHPNVLQAPKSVAVVDVSGLGEYIVLLQRENRGEITEKKSILASICGGNAPNVCRRTPLCSAKKMEIMVPRACGRSLCFGVPPQE